jgi:hypothetical protein
VLPEIIGMACGLREQLVDGNKCIHAMVEPGLVQ